MEAIGALLGQIAGLGYNTQNNNMDGNVLAGLAHNRHGLQGVMTEIQSFSQGLNLLLLALVVIVPVLSLSAIALDWAYFFRGISVDHTNIHGYTPTDEQNYDMGGTATPPMMVSISRGDGIQVTILKAVISSVIGFFVVQLLKINSTPENVSKLGKQRDHVSSAAHTVAAYLAARRSVVCFFAAAVTGVASVLLFFKGNTVVSLSFAAMTSMFIWAGAAYGHTSQQQLFMTVNANDLTREGSTRKDIPSGSATNSSDGPRTRASATVLNSESIPNSVVSTEHHQMIHVVVAGMVNAGKTSLAKAVLNIKPGDTRAVAQSLVVGYGNMAEKPTGAVRVEGDQSVVLYDLRGEDMMHGRWTQGAPEEMDIGLFVVEGSANSNNLQLYRELQRRCKQVYVIRSKADVDLDKLRPEARDRLIGQWKEQLGVDHIYTTSIRGYDEMKEEVHFVDGVEELLQAMGLYLESNGKDILLARYQKEKGRAATNVIVKAVSKVMLGDAVHTVEQQAAERLHYIYTGSWDIRVLPPEIHPVVGLSSRLVSLLPVVGKVSDQLVGASTMCLQLLALAHGLRKFDGAPETPTEDAQSAANTFATTVNYDTVRSLFENVTAKVYDHGGAVYEAGEEYFFDNIGSLLANGITKPRQRRN